MYKHAQHRNIKVWLVNALDVTDKSSVLADNGSVRPAVWDV